jgi:DNA-binding transcriptional MerR regulator
VVWFEAFHPLNFKNMHYKENIPLKRYWNISEVAKLLEIQTYVLRFWENDFGMLYHKKNREGNRLYTKVNIEKIKEIHRLLKVELYTIKGTMRQLRLNAMETWKPIKNYPGYQISSHGNVKRLSRNNEKVYKNSNGGDIKYKSKMKEKPIKVRGSMVQLYCNGARNEENINRLLSIHFE